MTIPQKQHLLGFLGYYQGKVDGDWGPASRQALAAFQKDHCKTVDGIWGEESQTRILEVISRWEDAGEVDWWKEIRHFTREEFRCKCGKYCSGYPAQMRRQAVLLADRAREHFGKPGYVVSGLRCRQHNADVGGVANSQHMYGEAVDLRIQNVDADTLLEFFRKQPEVRYAYKINETNVHFDIPKGER